MKLGVREILLFALILGVLGGSYFFGFRRTTAERERKLAEIQRKEQHLANLRQVTSGIDDLNRKIDEFERAIAFFESKLPQEKEVDQILKEVWQLAEANSLQTKTIKTMRSEKAANYSEQPIQLSLSGDFNGFYAFMLQLEKLPRITRIGQMNLQKINGHDGEMQAQLTMSIFFEPDGQGAQ